MSLSDWPVLVPIEVLEGETVPESVIDLLATVPVVLLGYHVLPEQTPPGQARLQFEDQAQSKLEILADAFDEVGDRPDTRLVFTHDEEQTLDRVAYEAGCQAILIPNPAPEITRLLVPVRGEADVTRISTFVAALIGDRQIAVTLLHVAKSEEESAAGEALLEAGKRTLTEHGITAENITTETAISDSPVEAITTAATDYDATVMGASEPSLRGLLFGESAEQVAARSLGPVMVVRRADEVESEPEP